MEITLFIGRAKEIHRIGDALSQGKNVVVEGKYGIGRSHLVRHAALALAGRYRFVFADFSGTPAKVCRELEATLFPENAGRRGAGRGGYKSSRHRVCAFAFPDERRHVLVLDNVAKCSRAGRELIRELSLADRFRMIAIVEAFLGNDELVSLRAALHPVVRVSLARLSRKEALAFFRLFSEQHDLDWTEERISHLAEMTGGYPLGMKEEAMRQLHRDHGARAPDRGPSPHE